MCVHCISDPNFFTHFSSPTFDTLLHVDMVTHADSLSVSLHIDPYCSFCTHRLVSSFSQFGSGKRVCVCVRERASVLWCCLYLVDVFCFLNCGCWCAVTAVSQGADKMSSHRPEVILNNFNTRLGHSVGRMLASLFNADPNYSGRRVVTFHNQRDFIFFRQHRYSHLSCVQDLSLCLELEFELSECHALSLKWLKQNWASSMSHEVIGELDPGTFGHGCAYTVTI